MHAGTATVHAGTATVHAGTAAVHAGIATRRTVKWSSARINLKYHTEILKYKNICQAINVNYVIEFGAGSHCGN